MHLISPLIAGVAGAENGHVELYQRGTTTRATWYGSFEADDPNSTGSDIALDANGGKEIYVNELVDVKVVSSSANGSLTIRNFTAGDASTAQEVISQSFTGTDYVGGASGASKPTTTLAVLDLWKDQAGAIDWQIRHDTTTRTPVAWVSSFKGVWVSVKDDAYGAKGDGTTDDTAAINAAIDAVQVAGGGVVVFPQSSGAYVITSKLTVDPKVNLIAQGPAATRLSINHASNGMLEVLGSASSAKQHQVISGFEFIGSVANTGTVLTTSNTRLIVENCIFGGDGNIQGNLIAASGTPTLGDIVIRDCKFTLGADSTRCINLPNGAVRKVIENCLFTPHTTFNTQCVRASNFRMRDCDFDNSGVTAGTFQDVRIEPGGDAWVSGCSFNAHGGATLGTALDGNSLASGEIFREWGNEFVNTGANAIVAYNLSSGSDEDRMRLGSRDKMTATLVDNSSSASISSEQFGSVVLETTSAATHSGAQTAALNTNVPLGQHFFLILHNNGTGGNVVWTISGGTVSGTVTVADNKKKIIHFISVPNTSSASTWYQVNTPIEVDE